MNSKKTWPFLKQQPRPSLPTLPCPYPPSSSFDPPHPTLTQPSPIFFSHVFPSSSFHAPPLVSFFPPSSYPPVLFLSHSCQQFTQLLSSPPPSSLHPAPFTPPPIPPPFPITICLCYLLRFLVICSKHKSLSFVFNVITK